MSTGPDKVTLTIESFAGPPIGLLKNHKVEKLRSSCLFSGSVINETPEHENILQRTLGLSGTHAGIGPFNVLNLSIPKWFVRRRAYQLPLRPASECTYGRRSTFLLAAVITSFAGFFFFPAGAD